jgi:hypothetical protein
MVDEPLPDELAQTAMRVDDLVRHFEDHPDPLVREPALELLQHIDALHRVGLRRIAELLRAAGLERRALDDAEIRLLYDLYELYEHEAAATPPPVPRGSFVPLSNLLGDRPSHG